MKFLIAYLAGLDRTALKIAALSTAPGIGQWLNGRKDKALAFFAVDLVNLALIALISGFWRSLPWQSMPSSSETYHWLHFNSWQPGSFPVLVIYSLMASFVIYSQMDAYKDALRREALKHDLLNRRADQAPEGSPEFSAEHSPVPAELSPDTSAETGTKRFTWGYGKAAQDLSFTLTQTASASYVMHLSLIMSVILLLVYKILPSAAITYERPQITLDFELASHEFEEEKAKGVDGKLGEESNVEEGAHLKDRPKDEVKASNPSKELNSLAEESRKSERASRETEAAASKEVISTESALTAIETASNGQSDKAVKVSKKEQQERQLDRTESESGHSNPNSQNSDQFDSKEHTEITESLNREEQAQAELNTVRSSKKLIAQLATASAAGGFVSEIGRTRIDTGRKAKSVSLLEAQNNSVLSSASTSGDFSRVTDDAGSKGRPNKVYPFAFDNTPPLPLPESQANNAQLSRRESFNKTNTQIEFVPPLPPVTNANCVLGPYVGLSQTTEPLRSAWTSPNVAAATTAAVAPPTPVPAGPVSSASSREQSTSSAQSPSMLGFMDAKFTEDDAMRAFWAEYSGNLSRYIKAHPLQGDGMVVSSFTLDAQGRPQQLEFSPENPQLIRSLSAVLKAEDVIVAPPVAQLSEIHVQVKAAKVHGNTFVSLEINSQYSPPNRKSLNDFRYQTNLQAYLKTIKKAVYSSWKPPVQEGVKPVMVGFKVSTSGKVFEQHIVQSSGDPAADRAALYAAHSVSKWSQPPAGTSEDLDVCLVLQKCKECNSVDNTNFRALY